MTAALAEQDAPPAAPAPAQVRPRPRLGVMVMARTSLAWLGIAWCSTHTALALSLGIWLADPRTPGVVALGIALTGYSWWYLRFPVGRCEPSTNTYVEFGPYGMWSRRRPSRPGRTLTLRGDRIVESGRPTRTVVHGWAIRRSDWATVARAVRTAPASSAATPPPATRPHFLTRWHRRTGWCLAALAAAGVLHLAGLACLDLASAWHR
jgi:hypothetical protein